MERTFYSKALIGFFRFFGVMISIIGLILFIRYFGVLIDPEASVKINGVPTTDLSVKIGVVLFILFFVSLGLLLVLLRTSALERIFIPKFVRYKK